MQEVYLIPADEGDFLYQKESKVFNYSSTQKKVLQETLENEPD